MNKFSNYLRLISIILFSNTAVYASDSLKLAGGQKTSHQVSFEAVESLEEVHHFDVQREVFVELLGNQIVFPWLSEIEEASELG